MLINSDFLGQGFAYPLCPSAKRSLPWQPLSWVGGDDDIKQSVWIILSTTPGERMMNPTFGCRLKELVFAAANFGTCAQAEQYVRQALDTWEPRIDVTSVSATVDTQQREQITVNVDYMVRETNTPNNVVFPFSLR
jgi:phage baseplate assembly protein W